jgi:predicted dinucleotide-utilizing enzyme
MHWTPVLLAEVVRRRVYIASEGAFGSLDAITSPALRDVETMLARKVAPLPREIQVLARCVLVEHVQRSGNTGKIQEGDVEAAIKWYAGNRLELRVESETQGA